MATTDRLSPSRMSNVLEGAVAAEVQLLTLAFSCCCMNVRSVAITIDGTRKPVTTAGGRLAPADTIEPSASAPDDNPPPLPAGIALDEGVVAAARHADAAFDSCVHRMSAVLGKMRLSSSRHSPDGNTQRESPFLEPCHRRTRGLQFSYGRSALSLPRLLSQHLIPLDRSLRPALSSSAPHRRHSDAVAASSWNVTEWAQRRIGRYLSLAWRHAVTGLETWLELWRCCSTDRLAMTGDAHPEDLRSLECLCGLTAIFFATATHVAALPPLLLVGPDQCRQPPRPQLLDTLLTRCLVAFGDFVRGQLGTSPPLPVPTARLLRLLGCMTESRQFSFENVCDAPLPATFDQCSASSDEPRSTSVAVVAAFHRAWAVMVMDVAALAVEGHLAPTMAQLDAKAAAAAVPASRHIGAAATTSPLLPASVESALELARQRLIDQDRLIGNLALCRSVLDCLRLCRGVLVHATVALRGAAFILLSGDADGQTDVLQAHQALADGEAQLARLSRTLWHHVVRPTVDLVRHARRCQVDANPTPSTFDVAESEGARPSSRGHPPTPSARGSGITLLARRVLLPQVTYFETTAWYFVPLLPLGEQQGSGQDGGVTGRPTQRRLKRALTALDTRRRQATRESIRLVAAVLPALCGMACSSALLLSQEEPMSEESGGSLASALSDWQWLQAAILLDACPEPSSTRPLPTALTASSAAAAASPSVQSPSRAAGASYSPPDSPRGADMGPPLSLLDTLYRASPSTTCLLPPASCQGGDNNGQPPPRLRFIASTGFLDLSAYSCSAAMSGAPQAAATVSTVSTRVDNSASAAHRVSVIPVSESQLSGMSTTHHNGNVFTPLASLWDALLNCATEGGAASFSTGTAAAATPANVSETLPVGAEGMQEVRIDAAVLQDFISLLRALSASCMTDIGTHVVSMMAALAIFPPLSSRRVIAREGRPSGTSRRNDTTTLASLISGVNVLLTVVTGIEHLVILPVIALSLGAAGIALDEAAAVTTLGRGDNDWDSADGAVRDAGASSSSATAQPAASLMGILLAPLQQLVRQAPERSTVLQLALRDAFLPAIDRVVGDLASVNKGARVPPNVAVQPGLPSASSSTDAALVTPTTPTSPATLPVVHRGGNSTTTTLPRKHSSTWATSLATMASAARSLLRSTVSHLASPASAAVHIVPAGGERPPALLRPGAPQTTIRTSNPTADRTDGVVSATQDRLADATGSDDSEATTSNATAAVDIESTASMCLSGVESLAAVLLRRLKAEGLGLVPSQAVTSTAGGTADESTSLQPLRERYFRHGVAFLHALLTAVLSRHPISATPSSSGGATPSRQSVGDTLRHILEWQRAAAGSVPRGQEDSSHSGEEGQLRQSRPMTMFQPPNSSPLRTAQSAAANEHFMAYESSFAAPPPPLEAAAPLGHQRHRPPSAATAEVWSPASAPPSSPSLTSPSREAAPAAHGLEDNDDASGEFVHAAIITDLTRHQNASLEHHRRIGEGIRFFVTFGTSLMDEVHEALLGTSSAATSGIGVSSPGGLTSHARGRYALLQFFSSVTLNSVTQLATSFREVRTLTMEFAAALGTARRAIVAGPTHAVRDGLRRLAEFEAAFTAVSTHVSVEDWAALRGLCKSLADIVLAQYEDMTTVLLAALTKSPTVGTRVLQQILRHGDDELRSAMVVVETPLDIQRWLSLVSRCAEVAVMLDRDVVPSVVGQPTEASSPPPRRSLCSSLFNRLQQLATALAWPGVGRISVALASPSRHSFHSAAVAACVNPAQALFQLSIAESRFLVMQLMVPMLPVMTRLISYMAQLHGDATLSGLITSSSSPHAARNGGACTTHHVQSSYLGAEKMLRSLSRMPLQHAYNADSLRSLWLMAVWYDLPQLLKRTVMVQTSGGYGPPVPGHHSNASSAARAAAIMVPPDAASRCLPALIDLAARSPPLLAFRTREFVAAAASISTMEQALQRPPGSIDAVGLANARLAYAAIAVEYCNTIGRDRLLERLGTSASSASGGASSSENGGAEDRPIGSDSVAAASIALRLAEREACVRRLPFTEVFLLRTIHELESLRGISGWGITHAATYHDFDIKAFATQTTTVAGSNSGGEAADLACLVGSFLEASCRATMWTHTISNTSQDKIACLRLRALQSGMNAADGGATLRQSDDTSSPSPRSSDLEMSPEGMSLAAYAPPDPTELLVADIVGLVTLATASGVRSIRIAAETVLMDASLGLLGHAYRHAFGDARIITWLLLAGAGGPVGIPQAALRPLSLAFLPRPEFSIGLETAYATSSSSAIGGGTLLPWDTTAESADVMGDGSQPRELILQIFRNLFRVDAFAAAGPIADTQQPRRFSRDPSSPLSFRDLSTALPSTDGEVAVAVRKVLVSLLTWIECDSLGMFDQLVDDSAAPSRNDVPVNSIAAAFQAKRQRTAADDEGFQRAPARRLLQWSPPLWFHVLRAATGRSTSMPAPPSASLVFQSLQRVAWELASVLKVDDPVQDLSTTTDAAGGGGAGASTHGVSHSWLAGPIASELRMYVGGGDCRGEVQERVHVMTMAVRGLKAANSGVSDATSSASWLAAGAMLAGELERAATSHLLHRHSVVATGFFHAAEPVTACRELVQRAVAFIMALPTMESITAAHLPQHAALHAWGRDPPHARLEGLDTAILQLLDDDAIRQGLARQRRKQWWALRHALLRGLWRVILRMPSVGAKSSTEFRLCLAGMSLIVESEDDALRGDSDNVSSLSRTQDPIEVRSFGTTLPNVALLRRSVLLELVLAWRDSMVRAEGLYEGAAMDDPTYDIRRTIEVTGDSEPLTSSPVPEEEPRNNPDAAGMDNGISRDGVATTAGLSFVNPIPAKDKSWAVDALLGFLQGNFLQSSHRWAAAPTSGATAGAGTMVADEGAIGGSGSSPSFSTLRLRRLIQRHRRIGLVAAAAAASSGGDNKSNPCPTATVLECSLDVDAFFDELDSRYRMQRRLPQEAELLVVASVTLLGDLVPRRRQATTPKPQDGTTVTQRPSFMYNVLDMRSASDASTLLQRSSSSSAAVPSAMAPSSSPTGSLQGSPSGNVSTGASGANRSAAGATSPPSTIPRDGFMIMAKTCRFALRVLHAVHQQFATEEALLVVDEAPRSPAALRPSRGDRGLLMSLVSDVRTAVYSVFTQWFARPFPTWLHTNSSATSVYDDAFTLGTLVEMFKSEGILVQQHRLGFVCQLRDGIGALNATRLSACGSSDSDDDDDTSGGGSEGGDDSDSGDSSEADDDDDEGGRVYEGSDLAAPSAQLLVSARSRQRCRRHVDGTPTIVRPPTALSGPALAESPSSVQGDESSMVITSPSISTLTRDSSASNLAKQDTIVFGTSAAATTPDADAATSTAASGRLPAGGASRQVRFALDEPHAKATISGASPSTPGVGAAPAIRQGSAGNVTIVTSLEGDLFYQRIHNYLALLRFLIRHEIERMCLWTRPMSYLVTSDAQAQHTAWYQSVSAEHQATVGVSSGGGADGIAALGGSNAAPVSNSMITVLGSAGPVSGVPLYGLTDGTLRGHLPVLTSPTHLYSVPGRSRPFQLATVSDDLWTVYLDTATAVFPALAVALMTRFSQLPRLKRMVVQRIEREPERFYSCPEAACAIVEATFGPEWLQPVVSKGAALAKLADFAAVPALPAIVMLSRANDIVPMPLASEQADLSAGGAPLAASSAGFWLPHLGDPSAANTAPIDGVPQVVALANATSNHSGGNPTSATLVLGGGISPIDQRKRAAIRQFALRSLQQCAGSVLSFWLPQLMQLLKNDKELTAATAKPSEGAGSASPPRSVADVLFFAAQRDELFLHQLTWALHTEAPPQANEAAEDVEFDDEGNQLPPKALPPSTPLKMACDKLLSRVANHLDPYATRWRDDEIGFMQRITELSGILKSFEKTARKPMLHELLSQPKFQVIAGQSRTSSMEHLSKHRGGGGGAAAASSLSLHAPTYIATNANLVIDDIIVSSASPMQSAAKCPILVLFRCHPVDIASVVRARCAQRQQQQSGPAASSTADRSHTAEKGFGAAKKHSASSAHQRRPPYSSRSPPASPPPAESLVRGCIFKMGDDCRQDQLALQIIGVLKRMFDAVEIPCFLSPYRVITTGPSSGIIECVPQTKSRDQIGKLTEGNLYDYFIAKYGPAHSPRFQAAQRNFVRSMASYSVVSYLLNIKDRHNGNILLDEQGHLVHIDFGFIFDISPGGDMQFESSPFKLTHEMLLLMGAIAPPEAAIDMANAEVILRQLSSHAASANGRRPHVGVSGNNVGSTATPPAPQLPPRQSAAGGVTGGALASRSAASGNAAGKGGEGTKGHGQAASGALKGSKPPKHMLHALPPPPPTPIAASSTASGSTSVAASSASSVPPPSAATASARALLSSLNRLDAALSDRNIELVALAAALPFVVIGGQSGAPTTAAAFTGVSASGVGAAAPTNVAMHPDPVAAIHEHERRLQNGRNAQLYMTYVHTCVQCFLAARDFMDPLCGLVAPMLASGLPCFKPAKTLADFRNRLAVGLTDVDAARFFVDRIRDSSDNVRTRLYDRYQNIYEGIEM